VVRNFFLKQPAEMPEDSMKKMVASARGSANTGDTVPTTVSKPRELLAGYKNKDNRNVPVGTFFRRLARHEKRSKARMEETYLAIKLKRTDTTLDLSQKALK
jgi:hypothetical protein